MKPRLLTVSIDGEVIASVEVSDKNKHIDIEKHFNKDWDKELLEFLGFYDYLNKREGELK
jgi:hypothetical protein